MAKKKVTKKKVTKKSSRSAAAGKRGASSPAARKKTAKKKTTAKKTTSKKAPATAKSRKTKKSTAAKTSAAKKTTKKKSSPRTSKKATKKTSKKTTKKKTTEKATASKKPAKKTTNKKTTTKKKVAKKTSKKKTTDKKTAPAGASKTAASPSSNGKASGAGSKPEPDSKGKKKRSSKSKKAPLVMPDRPLLLGPGGPALKPLIPSGAKAQPPQSVLDNVTSRRKKTPLTKTQLENYRQVLLAKRAEILGDMRHLEDEALRSDSGRSSHTSQHMDEAGSESYEQSLNLNLAAWERERINEIDAALERIVNRTYGLCEMTFEPIKRARLDEIPWARYTIEAARELDRRGDKR